MKRSITDCPEMLSLRELIVFPLSGRYVVVGGNLRLRACRELGYAERWLEEARLHPIPIPDYTYDVHTRKGRKAGRTKEEFFREEFEALKPRVPGLFDGLVPGSEGI